MWDSTAFRHYLRVCQFEEADEAWAALPLWLRVRLGWDCGWLDAVYEICPPLGSLLIRGMRRVGL